MKAGATGTCDVCGKPGIVHLTELRDGTKTTRSLCLEHAPPDMREKIPFGPHRSAAEEIAFLREKMEILDQRITDPAQRKEFKADIENLIADIEAGRRLGDPE